MKEKTIQIVETNLKNSFWFCWFGLVWFCLVLFGFLKGFERGSAKLRLACGPCRGRTLAKTRKRGCKTAEKQRSKKIDPPGEKMGRAKKGSIRGP